MSMAIYVEPVGPDKARVLVRNRLDNIKPENLDKWIAVPSIPEPPQIDPEEEELALYYKPSTEELYYEVKKKHGARVSVSDFLGRIPIEAEIAIRAAADTDPVIATILRRLDLAVEERVRLDLSHPAIVGGLNYLVSQEYLTQAQVDDILA